MRPLSQSGGHDPPGLIGELVPSFAVMVDQIVVGFEDVVREPVVTHELPFLHHASMFIFSDSLDGTRPSGYERHTCRTRVTGISTKLVPSCTQIVADTNVTTYIPSSSS